MKATLQPPRAQVLWKRRKLARQLAQAWAAHAKEPSPARKLAAIRIHEMLFGNL